MTALSFEKLAEHITALKNKHAQKLIGIDGGGAGKSTFAKHLKKSLPKAVIIHVDDFYKGPWNKRLDHTNYSVNPFFDWDRFYIEIIQPIQQGMQVKYHVYDWHTHTADKIIRIAVDRLIIVEGGYATQERFSDVYDFKIWIEADEGHRLQKALVRDGEHMRFLWEEDWLPVERNYIQTDNPASRADLVVIGHSGDFSNNTFNLINQNGFL